MKIVHRNQSGITLAELLVTLAVIIVLTVALGFSYVGWLGAYQVEKQIREVHGDLMNVRARAMDRHRSHFVTLAAQTFSAYEDTSPVPDGNRTLETAADQLVVTRTFTPNRQITWNGAATVEFTPRGLANVQKTICSNTSIDADFNCIVIASSRVNLGKLTTPILAGGACDAANCVAK